MRRYSFILIAVLSCISALMQAQGFPYPDRNDKWEFSIFAGSSHRGDGVFQTPLEAGGTSRQVGLNFAPGYLVGGRITENLAQHFGAELDYSLANQPVQFTGLSGALPVLNLDHRVHNITYSVLFYGTNRSSRFRPYGAIGPGVSLFETFGVSEDQAVSRGVALKDRWKIGASVGGGVKYRMTARTGFRFDVRDYITGVPGFGLPATGTAQRIAFRPDGHLSNWQLSAGFFFTFGSR